MRTLVLQTMDFQSIVVDSLAGDISSSRLPLRTQMADHQKENRKRRTAGPAGYYYHRGCLILR